MEATVNLDPPRSKPLLGAVIPDAELHRLDMGCEVLGLHAQIMREWAAHSERPALFGKTAWDYAPSLGDALRVMDRSFGRQRDACCGQECCIVRQELIPE